MITSLFLQCSKYKYLDLVTCVVSKKNNKEPEHERDDGVWKRETRLANFAFSLLVCASKKTRVTGDGYGRQM